MRLNHKGELVRTDAWREGKYLDLWSVPHFLSGMVMAFCIFFLGFEVRAALVIAFLLLVGYEMFEVIAKIEETRWNRTLDVVVGMASFVPTFLIVPMVPRIDAITAGVIIFAADCILSFLGWRESQKAAALEEKLRAELRRERERFIRRRTALAANWKIRRDKWRGKNQEHIPGTKG